MVTSRIPISGSYAKEQCCWPCPEKIIGGLLAIPLRFTALFLELADFASRKAGGALYICFLSRKVPVQHYFFVVQHVQLL